MICDENMPTICQLCENSKEIVESHIIPKFVFSWLKDTSPGQIREYKTPNLRVQDGLKLPMLCKDCELLFSGWENAFSREVFLPIHETQSSEPQYPYGDWALKFAVSVSWRVLKYGTLEGISHFSEEQLNFVEEALSTWKDYLFGVLPHPGRFEHHVLPLDRIASHSIPGISGFMNRYLLRSVDMDIIATESRAYVYAKMGRVMLLGTIQEPRPRQWKGTKLHVRKGVIGSKRIVTPFNLSEYLNYRANKAGAALYAISEKQENKIRSLQKENPENFLGSEIFQAIQQDVLIAGKSAFEIQNPDE